MKDCVPTSPGLRAGLLTRPFFCFGSGKQYLLSTSGIQPLLLIIKILNKPYLTVDFEKQKLQTKFILLTGQPEASEPAKDAGFFLPKILVLRHVYNEAKIFLLDISII
jgi:hypothetical protein